MEEELGIKRFQRGNRKNTLTEQGAPLRKRAEQCVELVRKTEDELDSSDSGPSIA